jgi:TatD DNase family protein
MTLPSGADGDQLGELIDFHCHVDLYPDHTAIVEECERLGIRTLAVTTTPRAWPRESELLAGLRFVRPALGLHPELVAEHPGEIALWERHLGETRYVGEVGLDARPRARSSIPDQQKIFRRVLDACAERGGKILTVHSAAATAETVRMIVDHLPPDRGKVVLHWFLGNRASVSAAIEHGCYFSINAAMLSSDTGRRVVQNVPIDRMLTETDGPFTQAGPRPARPSDVAQAVGMLSKAVGARPYELAARLRANLKALVG